MTQASGTPRRVLVVTLLSATVALGVVLAISLRPPCEREHEKGPKVVPMAAIRTLTSPEGHRLRSGSFPDFGYMVSVAEYQEKYSDQPLFRLKTDFPTEAPKELPAFMSIDFRADPLGYLVAARDYAFEGNLPDWNPHDNKTRGWYHIPWLHPSAPAGSYPPNGGTEGFHGLIKEAPVSPQQLGPDLLGKDGNYSVYAITLVNEQAGYTLGKMWADPSNPDPRATDKRYGGGFPEGTVFAKLLFTDAPQGTDKLPFLENPLSWTAYITENFWTSATRVVGTVNLLQMDIAVRDSRSPETGWVFGTFAYNGAVNNENKFLNLVPVGLMWGNDPQDRTNTTDPFPPTETKVNPALQESVIFPSEQLPPQHLGWNGRLNGPADLNTTSCMSCHIMAQYPAVMSLVPDGASPDGGPTPPAQGGTDEWMKWFANTPAATPTDPRVYSTDYSFQVAMSLTNFYAAKSAVYQGSWAGDYLLAPIPIGRGTPKQP